MIYTFPSANKNLTPVSVQEKKKHLQDDFQSFVQFQIVTKDPCILNDTVVPLHNR